MSLKIIDVSEHQGKINWAKAKLYIDGAIIRTGYGDNDKDQDDKFAEYNMSECDRLGIPYMTYLYSHADSEAHIKSEIEHHKRMIRGHQSIANYLDLEERSNKHFWKKATKAWMDAFSNGGVYSWQWCFEDVIPGIKCDRWICAYGNNTGSPELNYKPTISCDGWQYTSRGIIAGISGYVDISEWYSDFGGVSEPAMNIPGIEDIVVTKKMVAAEIMKHLCCHSGHGYTQDMKGRQGSGEEVIDVYGKKYTIKGGDRDCSSAVISAYEAAGISCGGATYTGNMRECMVKTGNFRWRPMSFIAQTGDTYLNIDCHTAMCLSSTPDILMEFSINEKGGTLGGKVGDQKQSGEWDETYGRGESHLKKYYDYPWNGILECINDEVAFVVKHGEIASDDDDKDSAETIEKDDNSASNKASISSSDALIAANVVLGEYGSGKTRERKLGGKYEEIQAIINKIWKDKSGIAKAMADYIVKNL